MPTSAWSSSSTATTRTRSCMRATSGGPSRPPATMPPTGSRTRAGGGGRRRNRAADSRTRMLTPWVAARHSAHERHGFRHSPDREAPQGRQAFPTFRPRPVTDVLSASQTIDLSDFVTKADLKTELAELRVDVFKSAVPLLPRQAALIGASVKLL